MPGSIKDEEQLSLKLMVVLSKAYKSITDRALQDIKSHGLSSSEFGIMEVLYAKGKFPIQQIGSKILISSGTMTYNIDKLEKRSLLRRVPCSEDRRVVYAELTDEGKDLFDRIFPMHSASIHKMLSSITSSQKHEAIALLKKLGKGVHEHDN
ncbi:MarR family winged helix-turn-helix transcriptional regulator [Paenibacillus mendelii]|uniref:MarR family winged helix-turn-helix transcriptional regulator n=1 Tax=Paenibacillus mendelii TaxID=206163 RepID=A0ABV6J347_9BACL|nr:MarR family transcriptional regulator [Paenibacillus mendelii]MCQ6559395.1 MarR family transcriptional regulator [Paenibacillus mendelii]